MWLISNEFRMKEKPNQFLCSLIRFVFSKPFYALRFQQKQGERGLCSIEEMNALGYDIQQFLRILLQTRSLDVLEFTESLLGSCMVLISESCVDMVDEDVKLLTLRREMCALMKSPSANSSATAVSLDNPAIAEFEEKLNQITQNRPSMLFNSSVIRYEYDDVPIGSILV